MLPCVLGSPGAADEVKVQGCYSAPAALGHRAATAALEEAAERNLTLPHTWHVSLSTLQTASFYRQDVIAALPARYAGRGSAVRQLHGGEQGALKARGWSPAALRTSQECPGHTYKPPGNHQN